MASLGCGPASEAASAVPCLLGEAMEVPALPKSHSPGAHRIHHHSRGGRGPQLEVQRCVEFRVAKRYDAVWGQHHKPTIADADGGACLRWAEVGRFSTLEYLRRGLTLEEQGRVITHVDVHRVRVSAQQPPAVSRHNHPGSPHLRSFGRCRRESSRRVAVGAVNDGGSAAYYRGCHPHNPSHRVLSHVEENTEHSAICYTWVPSLARARGSELG
jgi:hypothetical protein